MQTKATLLYALVGLVMTAASTAQAGPAADAAQDVNRLIYSGDDERASTLSELSETDSGQDTIVRYLLQAHGPAIEEAASRLDLTRLATISRRAKRLERPLSAHDAKAWSEALDSAKFEFAYEAFAAVERGEVPPNRAALLVAHWPEAHSLLFTLWKDRAAQSPPLLHVVGTLQGEGVGDYLADVYRTGTSRMRLAAIARMASQPKTEVDAWILQALDDPSPLVATEAANAAAALQMSEAAPFIGLLLETNRGEPIAVATALAKLAPASASRVFQKRFLDGDAHLRATLLELSADWDDVWTDGMRRLALRDPAPTVRALVSEDQIKSARVEPTQAQR